MKKKQQLLAQVEKRLAAGWQRWPEAVWWWVCFGAALLLTVWLSQGGDWWRAHPTIKFWCVLTLPPVRACVGWASLWGWLLRMTWGQKQDRGIRWRWLLGSLGFGGLTWLMTDSVRWWMTRSEMDVSSEWWFWQQASWSWQVTAGLILVALGVGIWLWRDKQRSLAKWCWRMIHEGVLAYFVAGFVAVGVFLALALMEALFDWEGFELMLYLVVVLWVIWPGYYLLAVWPGDEEKESWTVPKFWQIICLWLAGPLLVVYDLILYGYMAKQIWLWSWPEGGVINWVLWFALVTAAWLILTQYWSGQWLTRWRRVMAWSLWPLMMVALAAIGVRIGEHGWTIPRAWVVTGIGWVMGVIGLELGWRHKRDWWWLVMTIGILVIALLGPYLVIVSQKQRWGEAWVRQLRGQVTPTTESVSLQENFYFYGDVEELWQQSGGWQPSGLWLTSDRQESWAVPGVGQVSYLWLGDDETAGQASVGEVIVWRDGQEWLRFDLASVIADINRRCEYLEPTPVGREVGCHSYADILPEEMTGRAGLVWQTTQDGVTATFYLWQWRGTYLVESDEWHLETVKGRAKIDI